MSREAPCGLWRLRDDEAGEAYIASQKAEGWIALRGHFDDGGFSGGTLERPALRRLLKEIEAGKVDVVVVYKIDRLSPSLMDFAKLVEASALRRALRENEAARAEDLTERFHPPSPKATADEMRQILRGH